MPFVFTTGQSEVDLPAHFARVAHFAKPVALERVVRAISRAIGRNQAPSWSEIRP